MTPQVQLELEAAAFRRLVAHLDSRKDVQNIDLMNLSGFCRNCLSKWYKAAADERQIDISLDDAREVVYGMPYAEWKAQYQQEASAEQQAAFLPAIIGGEVLFTLAVDENPRHHPLQR